MEPPPGYNSVSSNNNNHNHNHNNNFSYNANNFGPPSTPPPSNNDIGTSMQHEYWSPSKNVDGMNNFIQDFDDDRDKLTRDGYKEYRNKHTYDLDLEDSLNQKFGYSNFRAFQREICTAILDGKDCLVIMPTGYGKS